MAHRVAKSYSQQPAGLLWLSIELETLDTLSMMYGKIVDHVA